MSSIKKNKIKITNNSNDQTDLNSNNNNKKFSCSIDSCNYKTDYKSNLDRHMKTIHLRDPKNLLHCTEGDCTYQTFISTNLDRHMKTIHLRDPKNLLHCTKGDCTFQTFQSESLDKHIQTQHIRDPKNLLHCIEDGCTYQTFISTNLDRHIKTQHIRDPKDLLHCTENGCMYQTFVSDNLDRHMHSNAHWYSQNKAREWEELCYEIATVILSDKNWRWKQIIFTPKIQERQYIIPEITIYKGSEIDTLIDAKMSIYALKEKDYIIYPQMAKKVIFWVLNGESHIKKYNNFLLEFIAVDDLKKKLLACNKDINSSISINNLLVKIDQCRNARTRNSSVNETKNKISRLDTFI